MAEYDKISSYIDENALLKETEFFLQQLKKLDEGSVSTADKIRNSFTNLFSSSSTTKTVVDDMKNLQLTTANYQKVLEAVATELEHFTDVQKARLKQINEQYKAEEYIRAGVKESVNLIKTEIQQNAKKEATMSELAETIAKNKSEQMALNRELKLAANVQISERNSLERAQALILKYTNEKKKLNLATEEGRRLNESYNKAIEKANAFILKNADAETKRTKNVGNYAKSAQIIVEALEKEKKKLEELEQARIRVQNAGASQYSPAASSTNRPAVVGSAGGGESLEASSLASDTKAASVELKKLDEQIENSRRVVEGFMRVTDQPKFLDVASKVGDANAELKAFTKQLIELERAGLGDSDMAKQLRQHLAELKDTIGDTKQEINALSSDTRGMDLFAGSVTFAADAMQTAAGAAALFGASEEDVEESIRAVVAIQSISNGVKGIANELTTRGTAANKLYAFSQKTIATAFDSSATSAARFRAALMTLGFGAIVVGIGLLIANFDKLKRVFTGVTKEQEIFNESQKSYTEGTKTAIEQVGKVSRAFEDAKNGVVSKEYALNVYNETLGDVMGKTDDLATAEQRLIDKADAFIKVTGLKAQANALYAESAKYTAESVTASMEDQTAWYDKVLISVKNWGNGVGAINDIIELNSEKTEEKAQSSLKTADELTKKADELMKQAQQLSRGNGLQDPDVAKFEEEERKKREDRHKKELEDRLKHELDAEKKRQEALRQMALLNANERIKVAQRIVDDENATYIEQLAAIQVIEEQKRLIASSNYAKAIEDEKKVEDGKIVIVRRSNEDKQKAQLEYEIAIRDIHYETFQAQMKANENYSKWHKEQLKKRREDELNILESGAEEERTRLQRSQNIEITTLNKKFERGLLVREEYEEKLLEIQERYSRQMLEAEIKFQKALIEASNLTEEEKEEALTRLLELEKELSDLSLKHFKTNEEKKREELLKTLGTYQDIAREVFGFASGLLDASATKEKNRLQEQRDMVEENAAHEIEAIESTTLSEEDKAAKIAIINAKAAAEKERLDRKERQADVDKAKFDKSVTVFNIILTNTLNVVKAIGNPLRLAAAIAMGAAQLAIAIATPIPKFKDGLGSDYEGLGITGDGGKKEAIIRKDGSVEITPARDTLTWINKGDRIHPDANEYVESMHNAALSSIPANNIKGEKDYSAYMIRALENNAKNIVKAITNKPETHLDVKDGALTSVWKYGARQVQYINENTNW